MPRVIFTIALDVDEERTREFEDDLENYNPEDVIAAALHVFPVSGCAYADVEVKR